MKAMESEKSHSQWLDNHISPKNSKWLAENLEEVDQSVKEMLKLIKEDGDSFVKKAGMYYEKRPELIAHVEGFYRMYRLLAERYNHLTVELYKNVPPVPQTQNPAISHRGSDQDTPFVTPDQKLSLKKFGQQSVGFDLFLSVTGGSSDLSQKEGSESSSFVSDSESELSDSSIYRHSSPHMSGECKEVKQKIFEMEIEHPNGKEMIQEAKKENADDELELEENGDYATLLTRATEYKQGLKELNKKLQLSEEQVKKLTAELKKNEALTVLIRDLQMQLELAKKNIKMREVDHETEKTKVSDLQKGVAKLEAQVSDSSHKIRSLADELEKAREKLKVSEYEIEKLCNEKSQGTNELQGQLEIAQKHIAMLEGKLSSEKMLVLELQDRVFSQMADVTDRELEIKGLNTALADTQKTFLLEKGRLNSDITALSEQLALLGARLKASEMQSKSLEDDIRRCEAEKEAMKCSHETQQIGFQSEIEQLMADVGWRNKHVEALNKNLDILKLKYDTQMAEKDGLNAKVHSLVAEMGSRDNQIQQLELRLHQVNKERTELITGSECAQNLVSELKLKVGELEKEVDRQSAMILDRAEEKREAIRQLCFSLEYYRNGYQELLKAFIVHKPHAVLAS
ncbi:protein NETWORKED 4A-like [Diospyros lotus]|uniref:protein NETWORKED 4A-like n=1 Tax=Diospyros lotus TaxID=55363 RepID=UPI00225C0E6B|nr:protein NETWORKED 4A-like [Diospyros lotus]